MNAAVRSKINNMLAMHGLGRLDDPGLPAQLGFLVQGHDHFRQLLTACEPANRPAMYQSLAPNLRFEAKPLDVYIAEAGQDAERRQLPTIGPDGALQPYQVPELRTAVQTLVEDAVAKGWLTLTCRKCTAEAHFSGMTKADAVMKARDAGWTYDEVTGSGREICPSCD